jgi:hypothetical protein
MSASEDRPEPAAGDAFEQRVEDAKRRIASQVSDLDPSDLDLIVRSILRPFGSGRRFFLRQIRPGVYVF